MDGKPILSHNLRNVSQDRKIIIENVKIMARQHVQSYHFCSNLHHHVNRKVNLIKNLYSAKGRFQKKISGRFH